MARLRLSTPTPGQYGDLISQNDGTSSKYHFDARGDTREITDEAENVTDTRTYDAWGNVVASTGSTPTPYQFVGKLGYAFDATLDHYYVRARWYQQQIGRWMSQDPMGFVDGVNRFVYGMRNLIRLVDPSGYMVAKEDGYEVGECGRFLWRHAYEMGDGEENGIALQRVCVAATITQCPDSLQCKAPADAQPWNKSTCPGQAVAPDQGRTLSHDFCYWEYWRIVDGKFKRIRTFIVPYVEVPGTG